MDLLVFVLFALLLLVIVSGVYTFVVACVRKAEPDWLDETALRKTSFGKYSEMIAYADQWLKDHDSRDVYITSEDGLKLHGLWVRADNPVGTVLLVHGYRSTKLVDFALAFDAYHNLGLNLLIPDQRSHGRSEGKYITFGVKESKDMLGWLEYHNRQLGSWDIILSGMSMGAATVLYMADMPLPENVRGIIADCGFSSPADIIKKVFQSTVHLPAVPSIWVADLCARIFAGFSLYEKSSLSSLKKNALPILLVHGKADDFVPCEMSKKAYDICTGNKRLLLVEGAKHGVSFLADHDAYNKEVEWLMSTALRKYADRKEEMNGTD